MADTSTHKNMVKKTTEYDPNEGTSHPIKKKKKKMKSGAYTSRNSPASKKYKKALDAATDW